MPTLAKWPLVALHAGFAGAILLHKEANPASSFDAFVQAYGRTYKEGSDEYAKRKKIYEDRSAEAATHNRRENRRWTAGVSHLWDWSEDELASLRGWRLASRPEMDGSSGARTALSQLRRVPAALPEKADWGQLTAMRYIRNQGGCGSCWAISASTVLQAHAEIHTKVKRTFSAQQIVSCTPNPQHCGGEGGCKGATVELAMEWVMQNGCAEDFQVPYAGDDGKCTVMAVLASSPSQGGGAAAFGMHGWERLPENKYEPLLRAIVERGPVAVSAAASAWTSYSNGVFDGCAKDSIIDHAVVAYGFGVDGNTSQKYWSIQNSWGDDWGEGGSIRIFRRDDDDRQCGINNKPEMGTGCIGGPKQVTVCGMCGILYDSVVPHFR